MEYKLAITSRVVTSNEKKNHSLQLSYFYNICKLLLGFIVFTFICLRSNLVKSKSNLDIL